MRKDSKKPKKRASWGSLSRSTSKGKAVKDGQEKAFVSSGQSRSEDGSPRATLEDESADNPDHSVEGLHMPATVANTLVTFMLPPGAFDELCMYQVLLLNCTKSAMLPCVCGSRCRCGAVLLVAEVVAAAALMGSLDKVVLSA